jgi:hypothetical protein
VDFSSAITIACLKSIFSTFGVCRHLVSDDGSQFTSREFRHFVFGLGIHHFTATIPIRLTLSGLTEI